MLLLLQIKEGISDAVGKSPPAKNQIFKRIVS